MSIKKLFNEKNLVFSFEIFPPKVTSPIDVVYKTLEELRDLNPNFISVTYGAGGNISENRTADISNIIKEKYKIEPMAHLTCINSTKKEIDDILTDLRNKGINNILALRGDIPEGEELLGEYKYASELIKHIKDFGGFHISAACYPEGHHKGESNFENLKFLKEKVDSGAEHLVSQLFFDNKYFYDFVDKARAIGIEVPIEAGIMPVVNKKQIERIVSLCGATFPEKFIKIVNKYEDDPIALRDAGIAYAVEQIVDLISSGVDGIHLYTMNNPYVARRISESVQSIINSVNNKKVI
ncbi:MAG: methylenetetrahydrofolate reductase [NAD(P)H] [Sarcina sp.]